MENAEFQHPDQPADILASLQAGLVAIQRKLDNRSMPEPDFKSQGNKKQFQHGVKVVAKLDQATEAIIAGDPASAQTAILEAKAEIVKRQKLIKIADRSPQGWQTVKEYIQDDLSESPEDEKRLKKAEKSAAEKQAEASARRSKASATQRSRRFNQTPYHGSFRRYGSAPAASASTYPYRYSVNNRICFQCGIAGHVRSSCPALRAVRQQQQYRGQPPIPGVNIRQNIGPGL